MVKRLLELKSQLKDMLSDAEVDSLLVVEWSRLQELCSLLEPFATQTDTLQTDTVSLSLAIPALLDMLCHLQAFPSCKGLTQLMLNDM